MHAMRARYEPVIGLEVHAQMLTATKAFCGCATAAGAPPNSSVCPICLGHPGVLPVLNERLVEFVVLMGLAAHCAIRPLSAFARKNYFYPDLPKGYQISQYEEPICHGGWIEIERPDGSRKKIGITRIHMEEDAGKSIHDAGSETLIDLNRCGVPLIEIVSEPDLSSPEEAHAYLAQIRRIVTYLGICDGNMEEGSLRCDANVSVRPAGNAELGTKTELKNLNSFRNVERGLAFEIERQIAVLEAGGRVAHETLLWDAGRNEAAAMRSKEEEFDYRYFPEPDLVPVRVTKEWEARIAASLPELPMERRDRMMRDYSLSRYNAEVMTSQKSLADFYEEACGQLAERTPERFEQACNWITGDFLRLRNEKGTGRISPREFASLMNSLAAGEISGKMGKALLEEMFVTGRPAAEIIERLGLCQVSDPAALEPLIDRILADNPASVAKYFGGRAQVLGFFVGQVMKETRGQANPELVNDILKRKLDALRKG